MALLSPTTQQDALSVCALLPSHSYLRNFVSYIQQTSDVPLAYAIGVGLSHLAAVASPYLHFRLPARVYPNMYILLAGSSGARKTTAMTLGDEILRSVAPKRIGEMPGSWEGLSESLQDFPSQLLQYGELGSFLARSNAAITGGSYYAALRQVYTELYDSPADWSRRKAKGKKVNVRNPRLSLIGASTPAYIEKHTSHEDWAGGFMGRFLCLYAERERTDYQTHPWKEREDALIGRLQQIFDLTEITDSPYLGRTVDAQALWESWAADVEERKADVNPWVASTLSRLPVNVMKIATLLALDFGDAGKAQPWHIHTRHLEPAIALVELHYKSACSVIDSLASTPYERNRRNVLRTLSYETSHTIGYVLATTQPRMDMSSAIKTLQTMVAAKDIIQRDGALGIQSGTCLLHLSSTSHPSGT